MHMHVGPEIVSRKYTVPTFARDLIKYDFGAVAKNHCTPTVGEAAQAHGTTGANIYGSVSLNSFVGGVNHNIIYAVEQTNKSNVRSMDPDARRFVVWMPVVSSEAHLQKYGFEILPEWGANKENCRKYGEDAVPVNVVDIKTNRLLPGV